MALAFFAMFPNDMTADTPHLDIAQFGAYHRILYFLWNKRKATEKHLRSFAFNPKKLDESEWKDVLELLETDGEFFWSKRLEDERRKGEEKHERRVNSGKKGGRPPKQKQSESNALAIENQSESKEEAIQTNHNHNHNHTLKDSKEPFSESAQAHAPARPQTAVPTFYNPPITYPERADFVAYGMTHLGHVGLTDKDWSAIFSEAVASEWKDVNGKPWGNWKGKIVHKAKDYAKAKSERKNDPDMLTKNLSRERAARSFFDDQRKLTPAAFSVDENGVEWFDATHIGGEGVHVVGADAFFGTGVAQTKPTGIVVDADFEIFDPNAIIEPKRIG